MLFPNVFIRLFVLIWLSGWLLALALGAWVSRANGNDEQRRLQLREAVALVFGSFLSWPLLVPFGLWAFAFGGGRRSSRCHAEAGVSLWPLWVTIATALIAAVLIGLIAASIISSARA